MFDFGFKTPVNAGVLWKHKEMDTVREYTSPEILFTGTQGEVFYLKCEHTNCVYYIDVFAFDNEWIEVATGSITDGNLSVVDLNFYLPKARVRIVPENVISYISIAGYGYPAFFISS